MAPLVRYERLVRNIIDAFRRRLTLEAQVLPHPGELQDLLTAMAESEPSSEQQTEFGMIAWYLDQK